MYRKRMSEALQEARAYTAVNEVMVSKGNRTLNISKKDLPVFRGKGWKVKGEELEEALSIPNARKEIQKIYDKAKRDGFLGTTGHDDFKELLKQTDRKKLYRDMHKVGSFFASASGAKPKAVGKELVDLSYKVNEETELEEAFSKKDFQKLEQSNDHTEAAEKLINMFGTSDEKKEMKDIKARHQKTGYINGKDYSKRQMMVNKYYSRLK